MRPVLYLLFVLCLFGCKEKAHEPYQFISYLDIGVDSLGHLPRNPYVLNLDKNGKELVVIGIMHSRDTLNPLFNEIENIFNQHTPGVIINEGGTISKTYKSRNEAINKNGELGLQKFLADNAGIKTVDGDAPFKEEFEQLAKACSEEEAILQYASERFILPYKYDAEAIDMQQVYENDFAKDYAMKSGINLSKEQQSFEYYKAAYRKYFNQEFSLQRIDPNDFLALSDAHHMCAVTRKSKEIRDIYLLRQIEKQLKIYDKVMVVYGGWHILAIEPALKQVFDNVQ